MKTPIPSYLRIVTEVVDEKKSSIIMKVKCTCCSSKFIVLKNKKSDESLKKMRQWEQLIKEHGGSKATIYSNDNGEVFIESSGFLGIRKKLTKINPKIIPKEINIIKAICCDCYNSYVIFDNRIHGYDAATESNEIDSSYSDIDFKEVANGAEVFVRIINDLTFEEFKDQINTKLDYEAYSNAFSDIKITVKLLDKKIKIHSEETA